MGTRLVELLLGTMSCASLVLAGCTRSGGAPSERSNPPLDSGAGDASADDAACPTACAFGCDPATTMCNEMVPASRAAEHLRAGDSFSCVQGPNPSSLPAISVPVGGVVTFDTNAQTITIEGSGQVFAPWGDPYTPDGSETPAAVVHIASLTLGAGANLRVTSTWPLPPTALILLVDGNVTAAGATQAVIDASWQGFASAGAMPSSVSAGGTAIDDAGVPGGGGAGHASPGGAGGCWPDGGGGAAGVASGVTQGREILQMGARGGGPWGAPGGGALQITACGSIELGAGVVLNASGGGGGGGPGGQSELLGGPPGFGGGGGGGGSGGTILLEASSISVLGAIAANGGGGGGGGTLGAPGANGAGGQSWDPTTSPSAIPSGGLGAEGSGDGDGGNGGNGGNGGAGGAGNSPSGQPGLCSNVGNGAGGGGGSVGAIFLNVPAGAPAPTIGSASPPPKVSRTCTTAVSACTYP